MERDEWIAVDLDGTLAEYTGWQGLDHIGPPIPAMVERIKRYAATGTSFRIFTARMSDPDGPEKTRFIENMGAWCQQHLGFVLPVTNVKDFAMSELWDDRAVAVEANTGKFLSPSRRGFE